MLLHEKRLKEEVSNAVNPSIFKHLCQTGLAYKGGCCVKLNKTFLADKMVSQNLSQYKPYPRKSNQEYCPSPHMDDLYFVLSVTTNQ